MLPAKNLNARHSWAFLLVLGGMLALPGCGGDDDEAAAGKSGASGASAGTAGAGATAGTAGDAGTAGTAGDAGAAGGGNCEGGVVVNGVCEGKCTPDKCLPGNTCVGNRCVLKCDTHADCIDGEQSCTAAKEDDTTADVNVCVWTGKAAIGTACPNQTECAAYGSCADGRSCNFAQCGGAECVKDTATCGADANCSRGLCPDNTPCTVPGCTQDQCKPLVCQSAGVGDLTAYCVSLDCKADTDCADGFYCATRHDPHAICGSTTIDGTDTFCGAKTTEPCVDPAHFQDNGATYSQGNYCLLRNQCVKRSVCNPCTTDLDCSEGTATKCATSGAEKRCATPCIKNADCGPEFHCTAEGACLPQFENGTCVGGGQFCEPCVNDADCAAGGPHFVCTSTGNLGERACFDRTLPDTCPNGTDAECPVAPSGKHGHCLNENDQVAATDPAYHRCYLPQNASTGNFQCW